MGKAASLSRLILTTSGRNSSAKVQSIMIGHYHDSHSHPVPSAVLHLLEELCAMTNVPGVMLERDGDFPPSGELNLELDAIAAAVARGRNRKARCSHVG